MLWSPLLSLTRRCTQLGRFAMPAAQTQSGCSSAKMRTCVRGFASPHVCTALRPELHWTSTAIGSIGGVRALLRRCFSAGEAKVLMPPVRLRAILALQVLSIDLLDPLSLMLQLLKQD